MDAFDILGEEAQVPETNTEDPHKAVFDALDALPDEIFDQGSSDALNYERTEDSPGFTEIVGDQIPADLAFDLAVQMNKQSSDDDEIVYSEGEDTVLEDDVLGGIALQNTVAFRNYNATRAAASRGVLDKRRLLKTREWQLDFGPVWVPAGNQTTITISPQCLFRGEKIMATDTSTTPGNGTRIVSVVVGQKVQKPNGGNGTLTQFFAATALANGIKFDTAQRWSNIAVTVSFVETCTFDMSIFGSCVVDE